MTETTRKGWVMVVRKRPNVVSYDTFQLARREAVNQCCKFWSGLTRRQVLRRYKPVKATMIITLEDE